MVPNPINADGSFPVIISSLFADDSSSPLLSHLLQDLGLLLAVERLDVDLLLVASAGRGLRILGRRAAETRPSVRAGSDSPTESSLEIVALEEAAFSAVTEVRP
jgi:hypothetical protein